MKRLDPDAEARSDPFVTEADDAAALILSRPADRKRPLDQASATRAARYVHPGPPTFWWRYRVSRRWPAARHTIWQSPSRRPRVGRPRRGHWSPERVRDRATRVAPTMPRGDATPRGRG